MEFKIQWKPFWLASQHYSQNDWTGWQNGVDYDVSACAPAPFIFCFTQVCFWTAHSTQTTRHLWVCTCQWSCMISHTLYFCHRPLIYEVSHSIWLAPRLTHHLCLSQSTCHNFQFPLQGWHTHHLFLYRHSWMLVGFFILRDIIAKVST